jgi:hypothetical protein
MKRIFVLISVIVMAMTSMNAENYVGFQIGYARSITMLNAPSAVSKETLNPTAYNGLKIGVVYDATIIKGFGVTMGLNYTFGANVTDWVKKVSTQPGPFPQVRSRGQYHQVEIPVDWQYKFEIAQNTWLMLYTGPTLQCGLAFKDKWYVRTNQESESILKEENIYSEQDMQDYTLKRMNVTWGIGAGFQYERYFLCGGYDFGLINPYKAQSFNNQDIHTRGRFDQWQIKLGVYLWEF